MALDQQDMEWLDGKFTALRENIEELRADVVGHVEGEAQVRRTLFNRLQEHDVVLRGEDGRDGLVKDVGDLQAAVQGRKAFLAIWVAPVVAAAVAALLTVLAMRGGSA